MNFNMDVSNHDLMIGLDLGGTKILGLVVDRNAQVYARIQVPTPRVSEQIENQVLSVLREMLESCSSKGARIIAIGIGIPGYVNPETGVVIGAGNLGIENLPLRKIVFDSFSIQTHVVHDVRAAALGETMFGAGRGKNYLGYVNIGTGISVGLVLDGKIYNGAASRAGEFGHIRITKDGPLCSCGSRGCLEALASGPAVAGRINNAILNGRKSLITDLIANDGAEVKGEIVAEAAKLGDQLALDVIDETAEYLALSIGSLINVLDLESIIIGGGLANMGDLLISPIRNKLAKYLLAEYKDNVSVLPAELGSDSGAIGAAIASCIELGQQTN
jgi:glucokinase